MSLYIGIYITEKTDVKRPLSERPKMVFNTNYRLMQVKGIEGEHSAILSSVIKLPFVIRIYILSIFEWPFYTDLTAYIRFYAFANNKDVN